MLPGVLVRSPAICDSRICRPDSPCALHIVEGKSSKEIAAALNLSVRTVEAHRASVLAKMESTSTAQLVRMALLAGASTS